MDKKIDISVQMAKDQRVPITLYQEPEPDDTIPNMIKRITLLGNVGNVADIDRVRDERDKIAEEVEILKTGKIPGGDESEDMSAADSLRSQIGTLEKTLNVSKIRISELEAEIAKQEAKQPERDAAHQEQIQRLNSLENANKKFEEDLAARAEEREKIQQELNDLKKVQGDAGELKEKLAKLTGVLDGLKKSNMEKEKELKASLRQRKQLHNQLEDLKGKIRVFCRIRPQSEQESQRGEANITTVADEFTVNCEQKNGQIKPFVYDSIYDAESTQEEIYEDTRSLVQSAIDGFNVCMLSYGPQGVGKSFTMLGEQGNQGITPRFINELFRILRRMRKHYEWLVNCSMVELHMDHLQDLFIPAAQRASSASLEPKKDPKGIVMIPGVTEVPVDSPDAMLSLFQQGNTDRKSKTASH